MSSNQSETAGSDPYNGTDDAEAILEEVMFRRNWTVETRDALAERLVLVVQRETTAKRRTRPRY